MATNKDGLKILAVLAGVSVAISGAYTGGSALINRVIERRTSLVTELNTAAAGPDRTYSHEEQRTLLDYLELRDTPLSEHSTIQLQPPRKAGSAIEIYVDGASIARLNDDDLRNALAKYNQDQGGAQ